MAELLAQGKDVVFITEMVDGFPSQIHSDVKRIKQVIMNLVSNAIKFTNEGSVTIKAKVSTSIQERSNS